MHPLLDVLMSAARGEFPPADGAVEVMAPDDMGTHAVVEFTGHAFILTDRPADEIEARGADGFGGASSPDLKRWLAGSGGRIGSHDAVLVARGSGASSLRERADLTDHPRVQRARTHRRDVRVHGDQAGFVTLGIGLAGRLEVSVELFDDAPPGRRAGQGLITQARGLVGAGRLVFAQVAPGNAASLRAFLRCGFVPIGAETIIEPQRN
jgi:hypothetical protein